MSKLKEVALGLCKVEWHQSGTRCGTGETVWAEGELEDGTRVTSATKCGVAGTEETLWVGDDQATCPPNYSWEEIFS
jgi:hypothetical protein